MEPDEDGFVVWCPALKGCQSFGVTKEEARENIREAMELWLEDIDDLAASILGRERILIRLPIDP